MLQVHVIIFSGINKKLTLYRQQFVMRAYASVASFGMKYLGAVLRQGIAIFKPFFGTAPLKKIALLTTVLTINFKWKRN